MTIATFLAPSQCYYHYPLAGMKMWLFVVDSRAPCLVLAAVILLYAYSKVSIIRTDPIKCNVGTFLNLLGQKSLFIR